MPRREDPQFGLGHAIRKLREERELTQESLAHRSDLHPTWISHIESGRINPTWGNVRRMARGLEVPLCTLAALAEELQRKHDDPECAKN
ncbi:MAG TPA: helix-turn-helix transcriptional regulator [Solirubrobacterales bacterium]|nr:helix-turn-helix transcriptional regulator [Solirubrobacterales bacterium]